MHDMSEPKPPADTSWVEIEHLRSTDPGSAGEEHKKKLKLARSRAEIVRTIVGCCQLAIALVTLIVVLTR